MSRRLALLPSIVLAFTLLVVPAARGSVVNAPAAATPTTMTYQGILRASGAPANGVFSLQFKIYNVPMGGAALYMETDSVTATNGLFTVIIGQTNPLPASLFQPGGPLFLGITVGADPELTPRTPLTTEPFAFRAGTADTAATFSDNLGGDVTGPQAATLVSTVGGQSASNVAGAVSAVGAATSANTANRLALRDGTGSLALQSLTLSGTVALPNTNSAGTVGMLTLGGNRFLHNAGTDNTFVGALAGNTSMTGNTTTAVGHGALQNIVTGGGNTAVGNGALSSLMSGSSNIAVGPSAGSQYTTAFSNIAIGNTGGAAIESNTIRIGGVGHTQTFIGGIAGATVTQAVPVVIDFNTGQLGTNGSSRRFKDAIVDLGATSEVLYQLRPVSFVYKPEYGGRPDEPQVGLIAEEVAAVAPWLVAYADDGQPLTVRYQELPPLLLNELQAQRQTIEHQATEQAALRAQLMAQGAAIASLQAQVAALAAQAAPPLALQQDGRN
jgi:hypothetical protein